MAHHQQRHPAQGRLRKRVQYRRPREWCYSNPSRLLFGDSVIASEVGAQQGDNLGPLLFALAIQPILEQLVKEGQKPAVDGCPDSVLDIVFSYLDDGVLAGDARAVARALTSLRVAAQRIGLKLNTCKCELIFAAGDRRGRPRHVPV